MNLNICPIARRWFASQVILFLALSVALVGCGPSTAPVKGTVTYDGAKVNGGTLIFSPIKEGSNTPGPPGAAMVQEDGSFTVKVGDSEGAVVGKCAVSYTAPSGTASTDPKKQGTPSPYSGLVPKESTVEIKSGANSFNIELVKKGK
jgi:hypothetical protein